jgi:hypothetical protein
MGVRCGCDGLIRLLCFHRHFESCFFARRYRQEPWD